MIPLSPSLRQRRKYDSHIVWLYNNGKEDLLPADFRRTIPDSTAFDWRNNDYTSFYGSEFRYMQQEAFQWYELYHQHKSLEKVQRVIARVWVSVSKRVMPLLHAAKEQQECILNATQQLCTVLPKRLVLRLTHLSAPAFSYRLQKLKTTCGSSPLSLCFKRHPQQLALNEVRTIKEQVSLPEFACWPLVSIYYKALREGSLNIALSTFYKYVALLGLQRKRAVRQKHIPSRAPATQPNQFLHVDTTFIPIEHGSIKAAAVFVTDSYSKAILGWSVSEKHGAENVIGALDMALRTIAQYHPNLACATLVADGGRENHAILVNEYLAAHDPPTIDKVIAFKNVTFSNSQAEAINRVIKEYIRHHNPENMVQLHNCIEHSVSDYSFCRPHGTLKGLIPMEVYQHQHPDMDFRARFAAARVLRREQNKKINCQSCLTR